MESQIPTQTSEDLEANIKQEWQTPRLTQIEIGGTEGALSPGTSEAVCSCAPS